VRTPPPPGPGAASADSGAAGAPESAELVACSPQLLCLLDLEGTIAWCNGSMAQVLGYDPGQMVGVPLAALVHPHDVVLVDAAQKTLASAQEISGVEARFRCRDGSWRTLEWTVRVDASRGLVYGAARDVSEQRLEDEDLRGEEARLRAVLDFCPLSIFVKDLQGRYLIVNTEWSRVTGIAGEDVIGATAAESWPFDISSISTREKVLLETGRPQVSDDWMHTKSGTRHYRVSRFLLRDDRGTPYAIGGIASDVTARTEAEKALAARERLLATVMDTSPDIITLFDLDGEIAQVSAAGEAVLGRGTPPGPAAARLGLVHPDDVEAVAGALARLVGGKAPRVRYRHQLRHEDGHWVTLDSRGQAVYDDTGTFAGAVVVSRDVTARILSERRLHDAREAAEGASRSKSEFLSRMSHELRTPLNAILGFAQLLMMDELGPEQSEAVNHILRAGRHLLDLIDEVLDIARIESGHLELMMSSVLLGAVVGDAVELTRPVADAAAVVIEVVDDGGDVLVNADRQRLLQVLLNLLSNAVKYNRHGGRVEVTTRRGCEGWVRLVVADTGRGIRAEDADRVFTPFDRLGAEHTGVEGSGVGLALSLHLVGQMGGSITFDSVPDSGSAFYVDLTTADGLFDSAAPVLPRSPGWPAGDPPAPRIGVFRVLLVEDDVAALDLVEQVLSRRPDVELLAAMQGSLGIELAREHLPNLVLVDLHLPDMPGTAVLERLAEDPATAALPVALVGTGADGDVRPLLARGVVGILNKPLDVLALLCLVDAVRSGKVA